MTGNMKLFPVVGDYFALDIGTTAVRAVKLAGGTGGWSLEQYGYAPIDIKLSGSDAAEDQRRLGEVITTVVGQSGIRSRNVVLGVPSDKMFATVIDLPNVPESEIESVVKYQAEQYIPMSLDKAKVDWALLGKSVNDQTKNEVLLASVANTFSETRLDLIEGLGFNVIAIEPDSLALTRSLLPSGLPDARLIIEVGDFTTDIVIAYADAPRLIRSVPSGMQSLVKAATQNLNIEAAQATQFILKFGVQPDKLEGQVLRAVSTTVEQFASELEKSLKFFQTKYPSVTVGGMIMSNYGLMIPGLRELLSEKVKLPAELGNPWQRVRVGPSDQQKLQPLSSQFAVAIGLAERGAGA
jgi:type IV pilus assembly protein PilM